MAPMKVHHFREEKETIYNLIKVKKIPYTIIDLGWWYQLSIPSIPTGRGSKAIFAPFNTIFGQGERKIALIHRLDIGKFIARILNDGRTLNKYVFCYGDLLTQREIINTMEEKSNEKAITNTISEVELAAGIDQQLAKLELNPSDTEALFTLTGLRYGMSLGIRGDNCPENAKYLGYLNARELYPDLHPMKFSDFLADVLEDKVDAVYRGGILDRVQLRQRQ
ncbi:isoflavone reductase [Lipomyces kononenkoae]|uniref:Isoflavone reductase n=1 Tax=Lipomyces kononenkoae TaxID=34357 RepID=A0ACC3SXQ7_LIPKO